jgi:hypothetical protein
MEGRGGPDRVGVLEPVKDPAILVDGVDVVVKRPEHDVVLPVAVDVSDRRGIEHRGGAGVGAMTGRGLDVAAPLAIAVEDRQAAPDAVDLQ